MPKGILIFGANGCGKTTLCRVLGQLMHYKSMDIEDYYFENSEIPYTKARSRDAVIQMMLEDIKAHGNFILSTVKGDLGTDIESLYELAIYLTAPLDIRMARVKERALAQHGDRVRPGGDMFEQEQDFFKFVQTRSLASIDDWAKTLKCPVITLDGTMKIEESIQRIMKFYKNEGQ